MRFFFSVAVLCFSIPSLAADGGWQFGLSASYLSAQKISLSGTGISNNITYKDGFGIGLEFWKVPKQSWGFGIGLEFWKVPKQSWGFISGFEYCAQSATSSGVATTNISSGLGTQNIQTNLFYIGTDYRWDSILIPLALVQSMPTFSAPNSTVTSVTNGVGFLAGIGYFYNERIFIDLIYETTSLGLASVGSGSGGTSLMEKSTGTWTDTRLNLHYFF